MFLHIYILCITDECGNNLNETNLSNNKTFSVLHTLQLLCSAIAMRNNGNIRLFEAKIICGRELSSHAVCSQQNFNFKSSFFDANKLQYGRILLYMDVLDYMVNYGYIWLHIY